MESFRCADMYFFSQGSCGSITPGVLRSFVPHLQLVSSFALGLSYSLTDDDVFAFWTSLPHLRSLDFRYYLVCPLILALSTDCDAATAIAAIHRSTFTGPPAPHRPLHARHHEDRCRPSVQVDTARDHALSSGFAASRVRERGLRSCAIVRSAPRASVCAARGDVTQARYQGLSRWQCRFARVLQEVRGPRGAVCWCLLGHAGELVLHISWVHTHELTAYVHCTARLSSICFRASKAPYCGLLHLQH